MLVPMMQIRIVRMLVFYSGMRMQVRMPFALRYCFAIVRMGMMPISMLMVMNMLHNYMSMLMFVRKYIRNDNCNS